MRKKATLTMTVERWRAPAARFALFEALQDALETNPDLETESLTPMTVRETKDGWEVAFRIVHFYNPPFPSPAAARRWWERLALESAILAIRRRWEESGLKKLGRPIWDAWAEMKEVCNEAGIYLDDEDNDDAAVMLKEALRRLCRRGLIEFYDNRVYFLSDVETRGATSAQYERASEFLRAVRTAR